MQQLSRFIMCSSRVKCSRIKYSIFIISTRSKQNSQRKRLASIAFLPDGNEVRLDLINNSLSILYCFYFFRGVLLSSYANAPFMNPIFKKRFQRFFETLPSFTFSISRSQLVFYGATFREEPDVCFSLNNEAGFHFCSFVSVAIVRVL